MTLMNNREYGKYRTICKMEFKITRRAQYSELPRANWFQIMTMVMHRAMPTMITPIL